MAKNRRVQAPAGGGGAEVDGGKQGRQPASVREAAVRRMAEGCDVSALARELGVHRNSLYHGRDVQEGRGRRRKTEESPREQTMATQIAKLERALGRKSLEVDFFVRALRRIEEKRPRSKATGGIASTARSGSKPKAEARD